MPANLQNCLRCPTLVTMHGSDILIMPLKTSLPGTTRIVPRISLAMYATKHDLLWLVLSMHAGGTTANMATADRLSKLSRGLSCFQL